MTIKDLLKIPKEEFIELGYTPASKKKYELNTKLDLLLFELPEKILTKLEFKVSDLYFNELSDAKGFEEWKEIRKKGIYTPERCYEALRLI